MSPEEEEGHEPSSDHAAAPLVKSSCIKNVLFRVLYGCTISSNPPPLTFNLVFLTGHLTFLLHLLHKRTFSQVCVGHHFVKLNDFSHKLLGCFPPNSFEVLRLLLELESLIKFYLS